MRVVQNSNNRDKGRRTSMRITVAFLTWILMILTVSAQQEQQRNLSASDLVQQFKNETVFWKQFEIAKKIVALHDSTVLPDLAGWLNHDDRHLRGNVAFV